MNSFEALGRVGAYGLPGESNEPIVVGPFSDLAALAESQRMLPWLWDAVLNHRVANVSDDEREHLKRRMLATVQTTLAAHSAAASVVSRLYEIGVADVRILKGCATAHLDYSAPKYRFSSDVDLLIRSEDRSSVLSLFAKSDVPVPRRTSWQDRYGKSITVKDNGGVELDMHVTLSPGYFGLVLPIDELFAQVEAFEIGGVEMHALDGPSRLIHAANHAAQSLNVGTHSVRDVPQLVLVSGVDWQESIERTVRWNVDGLFALGVLKSWARFDIQGHPLVEWAKTHEAVGRQRLALRLADHRPRGHLLNAPLALPPQRWPGYVLPVMFPSREYLKENNKEWSTRAKEIVREVFSK